MKTRSSKMNFEYLLNLNYNLRPEFKIFEKFPSRRKSTIFSSIFIFFGSFIKSFFKGQFKVPKFSDHPLIISSSVNNKNVLLPIAQALENCQGLGLGFEIPIPKFLAHLYSLPYLFKVLDLKPKEKGYNRDIYNSFFHLFWLSYGYLRLWEKIFKVYKPRFVLVSNDHLLLYRSILHVCNKLEIKTVYVQHAGTSINFPPLTFSYAFLDGEVTYENYKVHGRLNTSKIFLLGSPRFDNIVKIRNSRLAYNTLGLSINLLDDFYSVTTFVKKLLINSNYKIIIRFHPSIKDHQIQEYTGLFNDEKVSFSFPKKDSLYSYLESINFHLAGVSFIHFEAVLSGINSFFVEFQDFNDDPYNFCESGFILPFNIEKFCHSDFHSEISQNQESFIKKYISNYDALLLGDNTVDTYKEILDNI